MVRHGTQAAAQKIEARRQSRAQFGCAQLGRAAISGRTTVRVFDLVVGSDDRDHVVIEACEPLPDPLIDPFRIVGVADFLRRARACGDALDDAQFALALFDDGLMDQLLLGVERDFIGTPRGGEHRDHDAYDGDGNNHADRHDQADTDPIPPRPFAFPGDVRLRRRQHAVTLWS